jgi:hypothetical protein
MARGLGDISLTLVSSLTTLLLSHCSHCLHSRMFPGSCPRALYRPTAAHVSIGQASVGGGARPKPWTHSHVSANRHKLLCVNLGFEWRMEAQLRNEGTKCMKGTVFLVATPFNLERD